MWRARASSTGSFRLSPGPAAVGQGEGAAECHDDGAEPDEAHKRVEVEAHDPAAVFELVAKNHVEVAGERDVDGGFGGGLPGGVVEALGGAQLRHGGAAACH